LTNANLFVDGDGECRIYYLCSRLALTTKNATNRYVIRRIRGGGGAVAVAGGVGVGVQLKEVRWTLYF
jgi:hypothetical protein